MSAGNDTYNRGEMVAELMRDEGFELKPYLDTRRKTTIGIGRNLTDVGISEAEAFLMCGNDVIRTEMDLDAHVGWWRELDPVRQRALLNMCFNMGWGTLAGFGTFLALMQAGSWIKAEADLTSTAWHHEVGQRAVRIEAMIRSGQVPTGEPTAVPVADLPAA